MPEYFWESYSRADSESVYLSSPLVETWPGEPPVFLLSLPHGWGLLSVTVARPAAMGEDASLSPPEWL